MENKKYFFKELTPVSNADISIYEEAIDFAFENSDIKNVAISGAYGAGKSSILKSYKAKHPNCCFIHISLANFRTPEQENDETEKLVKDAVLEGKILNQLIHQIPAEKIPQTNFRVKKEVSAKNIVVLTILSSLLIGSIAFLLWVSSIMSSIVVLKDNWLKTVLTVLFNPYTATLATVICISCLVIIIYLLIKAQINKNILHKISLQGNEIEIFKEQDDSYFDKYLNEVLYLFKNVEADGIVFEDIDRFYASRIFERLREVNTLVNIQREKEKDKKYKPLRFFYLLRDDIFISKDRTKFFDFIIPIVPIVDSSNSYEQFLKHLKEGDLLDGFEQSFLQSLSLYVDDMRILLNICNEFVVYILRLNTTDLDWNKMMAMVTYKNLFPRDFSDLQLGKGFVNKIFDQKPQIIEASLKSAKERKKDIVNRIEQAKKETLISKQELDDAYAAKNGRLPKDRFNQRLTTEGEKQKELNDTELPKRKQAIQDVLEDKLPELEAMVVDLEREISLIQSKLLKALVTRENIDNIFGIICTNEKIEDEFEEIKNSDYFNLLKFLIRSGYIDETYPDYMTYFYEDNISAHDKTFLRRVTDRRGADYKYSIRNPKKVLESPVLRNVEFEQEETLNFDLLECLLLDNSEAEYTKYLETLIDQIRKTKNSKFISQFYNTKKADKEFVIKINEQWPDFFSFALQNKDISTAQIKKYSIDTLCFSDEGKIIEVNISNCLSDYISDRKDYLDLVIEGSYIDKLIAGFSLINVSFTAIDYEKANEVLFHKVYQLSLFKLTFENIVLMLKTEYELKSEADITHKNYTLVQSQPGSPLAIYVSKNMQLYVELILNNCSGEITDAENTAFDLLNNVDVDIDAKNQYIELLSTDINEIINVSEPTLWITMMEKNKVVFSISNFINYFQNHGIDKALVKYLNNVPLKVDFTTIVNDFGKETAENLFDAVVVCNDLSVNKYQDILLDLGYNFDSFEAEKIAEDKFMVLINEKILRMDENGLEFVRAKYEKHLLVFIKQNLNEYISLQTNELFRLDEALQIITWDIDDSQKISLLAFTNEPISIIEKRYSDEVNAYIIGGRNFQTKDKLFLYENYSQYAKKTQETISKLAVTAVNVNEIKTQNITIDDALLSFLLQSDKISSDQRIELFIMAIPRLNEDTCKNHFAELGVPELKGIFTKSSGRRNYEKSETVKRILDALKLNGWIFEYCDDERNADKYIIIKNKPRKENELLD